MNISRLDFFAGCALAGNVARSGAKLSTEAVIELAKELDKKLPREKEQCGDIIANKQKEINELRAAMQEIKKNIDLFSDGEKCPNATADGCLVIIQEIAARFVAV